jgi:hypothetical protein
MEGGFVKVRGVEFDPAIRKCCLTQPKVELASTRKSKQTIIL